MGDQSVPTIPSVVKLFNCAKRGIRSSAFNQVLIHVSHCLGRLPVSFQVDGETLRINLGVNLWQVLILEAGLTNGNQWVILLDNILHALLIGQGRLLETLI